MRIACVIPCTLWLLAALPAQSEEPPRAQAAAANPEITPIDFAQVDRTIGKLPQLGDDARYGLYLFGSGGETRVWAVLDRSSADQPYDVLYLDRNGDGDLTGADEKLLGRPRQGRTAGPDADHEFVIGDFRPPGGDATHQDFRITWTKASGVRFRMLWRGEKVTFGGYGPSREVYAPFGATPAKAPIFVPGYDRPLEFERWMATPLQRGGETDVRIFVGQRGDRTGAFSAVDDEFLPAGELLVATLRYRSSDGDERRARFELRQRC